MKIIGLRHNMELKASNNLSDELRITAIGYGILKKFQAHRIQDFDDLIWML